MKKTGKRIVTLLIAALLACSATVVCGCSNGDGETPTIRQQEHYQGTHEYKISETEKPFIVDGKTDYKLVIPKNASNMIFQAKEEFVHLFREATGITLRTVTDEGLLHDENANYISLGQTTLLNSSGITVKRADLGRDGGKIVTKDETVYICGGSDKGTLYAVYTFMQLTFHFEQYYIDCYEMDRNVKNMKLKKYDVTDIPDIAIRGNGSGLLNLDFLDYDEDNFAERMRMGTDIFEPIMPIHKEFNNIESKKKQVHNTFYYLPPEQYGSNEKWYNEGFKQLCYTAHGDETELAKMVELCAQKIENSLTLYTPQQYPQYETVAFMIEDGEPACLCEACVAMKVAYGTNAAAAIKFVNRVAEKVDEWLQKEENEQYRRDNFRILFCAYQGYVNAPVVYDEATSTYSPVDNSVKFHPLVGLYYAPMTTMAYEAGLFDEVNDTGRAGFEAWNCISDYTYYWLYATNFQYYNYMYDSFNFFTNETYAYVANRDAQYLLIQQQHDQTGTSTAWHNLKFYLDAKLAWNSSLDQKELIDDWFNAMYKEAAPIMKELFYEERAWARKMYTDAGLIQINSSYNKVNKREFWPYATLRGWLDKHDLAIEAVKDYQTTNPALYESICNHIYAEWISPAYAILELWNNGTIKQQEKVELINRFKTVLDRVDPNGTMQYTDYSSTYRSFIDGL